MKKSYTLLFYFVKKRHTLKKEYGMSSENNEKQSHSNETTEKTQKGILYYFDIFYRVSKSLIVLFIAILLVLGSLGAGTAIGYFASLVHGSEIPEYEEMEQQINDVNLKSTMFYAGGEEISDLRSDLIRTPVDLEDISPLLIDAMIATEDEYFYEHDGIVPKAVARALVQDLSEAESATGGSTLTQQLIKQQIIGDEVTHERKANEILLAMRIENHLEKDEILEAYLNVSPFGRNNKGENIAGVQEAAQGLFGVSASEVNLPQAAFIAGLPQSPIAYSPYTQHGELKENLETGINRQRNVLFYMYREGVITEEEYQEAREYDITAYFQSREEMDYDDMSFAYDLGEREARRILFNQLLEEDGITSEDLQENEDLRTEYTERADNALRNGGYRIYTTIDQEIHSALEQTVAEQRDSLGHAREVTWTDDNGETHTESYPVQIGGSLIENSTGRVIAFVGGRDYDESQYNMAFDSRRQPGSAIKPLTVFGPALAEGIITPATIIPDTEVAVPHYADGVLGEHTPTNYGATTNDWRSARHWLMTSQNIPATKIYMEMVNDDSVDVESYARRMGIDEEAISSQEFYNPATALGGVDGGASVTEMVGAYAAIANGGVHNEPYVIERIETNSGDVVYEHELDGTEVWDAQTNFLLLDMLRDVHSSEGTASGMMSQLNFDTDLFSKTGTSNDSRDLWYIGGTPEVTFGTWIGYDDQRLGLQHDFGIHPSQRNRNMWANLMNSVHSSNPDIVGADASHGGPPEGVTEQSVLNETGMRPGTVDLPGGGSRSISGSTHTEYFASSNVPGTTTYDFALGATDEELAEFWGGQASNNQSSPSPQNESDESDDDSADDEEEDEEPEEEDESEEENDEEDSNGDDDSEDEDEDTEEPEEEPEEPEEPEADDPGNGSDEEEETEEDDSNGDDDSDTDDEEEE